MIPRRSQRSSLFFWALGLGAWSAVPLTGCGATGTGAEQPIAALATSPEAQREFRALYATWSEPASGRRAPLEARLRAFIDVHTDDPRARHARIMLAWLLIEAGDLRGGTAYNQLALEGPPGTLRDLASVVHAAALRRKGQPKAALGLLTPLRGKLIGEREQAIYNTEAAQSAAEARRPRSTVEHLLDLLEQAPEGEQQRAREQVSALLAGLDATMLSAMLGALEQDGRGDLGAHAHRGPAHRWVIARLSRRLTDHALAAEDADLARRLLDSNSTRATEISEGYRKLSRLAASGRTELRVAGRSVGLVLATATAQSRARSAAVARGLTRTFRAVGQGDDQPVQLLTRDGGATERSREQAMLELASEGAALLIAGVDALGAARAQRFSSETGMPVLMLQEVTATGQDEAAASFAIGAPRQAVDEALSRAVTELGAAGAVRVGDEQTPCDLQPTTATGRRFPVDRWRRDAVGAAVVMGSGACASELWREAIEVGWRPLVVLGLGAAHEHAQLDVPPDALLSAGLIPANTSGTPDAELDAWRARYGSFPGWYESLAHDAALLASAATASLASAGPGTVVEGPERVAGVYRQVAEALGRARAPLWTSEQQGLEGGHQLGRTLRVLYRQPGGSYAETVTR